MISQCLHISIDCQIQEYIMNDNCLSLGDFLRKQNGFDGPTPPIVLESYQQVRQEYNLKKDLDWCIIDDDDDQQSDDESSIVNIDQSSLPAPTQIEFENENETENQNLRNKLSIVPYISDTTGVVSCIPSIPDVHDLQIKHHDHHSNFNTSNQNINIISERSHLAERIDCLESKINQLMQRMTIMEQQNANNHCVTDQVNCNFVETKKAIEAPKRKVRALTLPNYRAPLPPTSSKPKNQSPKKKLFMPRIGVEALKLQKAKLNSISKLSKRRVSFSQELAQKVRRPTLKLSIC